MAVFSSVPAVKNALYDRLAARPGLISSGLTVSYGPPSPIPGEFVWVAGLAEPSTEKQIGAGPPPHTREEDYVLEVIVSVQRQGGQQQECTERAYALAAEVADELADDPNINGSISPGYLAEIEGHQLVEKADDKQRQSDILMRVRCRTIIGP